jgi:hypothetical protein
VVWDAWDVFDILSMSDTTIDNSVSEYEGQKAAPKTQAKAH